MNYGARIVRKAVNGGLEYVEFLPNIREMLKTLVI